VRFAELALEAGLPPGVLNVVPGGAEAGQALVRDPRIGKISFTGGTATARRIVEAAGTTPVALELGGKSANIVFPDADLDTAVAVAAFLGAGLLSGQGCALPTRLLVHADVHDELVERVAAQAGALPVGDPLEPGTVVGPLVNRAAQERVLGVIDRAAADGGRVVLGGGVPEATDPGGCFVAPTVVADVAPGSELATQEVFGPVLAVLRFEDEEEALAMANDSDFGLAAYLHTRDLSRALRMVERLDAGTVTVNGFPPMSPSAPFGGFKASGFGKEGGRHGIEEFVRRKNVTILR
jgi:acyl-CoA reductase-like NAD-dependent aldehyde dehydrogenase